MRCGNCGFVNSDSRKNCEKCGSVLASLQPERSYNKVNEPVSYGTPTVRGVNPQPAAVDTSGSVVAPAIHKCPYCNFYPLKYPVSQAHPCVNCKQTGEPVKQQNGTNVFTNEQFWQPVSPIGTLVLTNMQTGQTVKFEGNDLQLNREKISPTDQNLSSKGHVQFTQENGQWYINDISSNKATFIQVQGKMPINPDTIVVLGKNFYKINFE